MSLAAKAFKAGHVAAFFLPGRVAIWVGQLFGMVAWLIAPAKRRVATRTMARVIGQNPDNPDKRSKKLAREMFVFYGRYWAELIWLRPKHLKSLFDSVTIEGISHIKQARERRKGVILLLPHMGNFEIFGHVAKAEEVQLVAIAERLEDRELTEWFCDHRLSLGVEVYLADGSPNLALKLLRVLARNGIVALLCDRKVSGAGTLTEVEFFGERTEIPSGFWMLAKHSGATVIPCAAQHTPAGGHLAKVGAPIELDPDDEQSSAQIVSKHLENHIQQAPSQWHLLTPNWPSDQSKS